MNSGIYSIRNLLNNKVYVGSAIKITRRKYHHFYSLKNGTHRNRYLQRAFDKYGESHFIFEILEEVNDSSNNFLLEREQYWMDKLYAANPKYGYNLNPNAANCGGRSCSPETKNKLRIANLGKKQSQETIEKKRRARLGISNGPLSEDTKQKLRMARSGKKHSQETIEKIKQSLLGNKNPFYGKHHSEETKKILREKRLGKTASQETRLKISKIHKGRKFSPEHRAKIAEANSRRVVSNETRQKMSNVRKGIKLSAATRYKMSESHKKL